MTRPLISIITPVLNRVGLIGAALDSVCRAGAVVTEHLVVDGGSTDGSLSLLRNRPGIRLVEAPGTGIYDALNLGLHAARGDILCQLNSDDLLSADREWLMRAFAAGIRIHQIPAHVYRFRLHRGSLTIDPDLSASVAIRLEHLEICRRILSSPNTPATLS